MPNPFPAEKRFRLNTRQVKIKCPRPNCNYVLRGSRKQLSRGLPLCPLCHVQMRPDLTDLLLDGRKKDGRKLVAKGRPTGNKKTVSGDSVVKIAVPEYHEPERIDSDDRNMTGIL